MKLPSTGSIIFVASLMLIHFCGCDKGASTANGPSPAETTPSTDNVTLDSLLERTDLNAYARSAFERSKNFGQTEMNSKMAEEIIWTSYRKKAIMVPPKTRLTSEPVPQPTHSRNDEPSTGEATELSALLAKERLEAKHRYHELGVDHFEQRFIYGLPGDVRADAADWMRRVLRQLPVTDCLEQWRALNEEADSIAARFSHFETDPMFCMCKGISAAEAIGEKAATHWFANAMSNFRTSDYPTRMVILCYQFDSRYTPISESREINYYIINAAYFHWIENDFRASGHAQRFAFQNFDRFIDWMLVVKDDKALEEFQNSIANSEQMSPWIKSMLLGKLNYDIGFSYRGSGFANTVTEQGWEKLKEHCAAAQEHFTEAYRIEPQLPESATEMIAIARLGYADEDEDYWFEKSIEYEPEYLPAYDARAFGHYPRWGGSNEELVEFILNSTQGTDSPCINFVLPRAIFRWRSNGEFTVDQWEELITQPKVNTEALAALDKAISKEQNVVVEDKIYGPDFFRTAKAIFAAKAENYQVSEATFEELGDKFSTAAMKKLGIEGSSFNAMRSSVYAFTSEYQADAFELRELWGNTYKQRHQNAEKILALTDGLAEWVGTHSGGLDFKSARKILQTEQEFLKAPIALEFDEDFILWTSDNFSPVEFVSPETIRIDNQKMDTKFSLRTAPRFMAERIFECDIKFPEIAPDILKASPKDSPPTDPMDAAILDFRPSVALGLVGRQYLTVGIGFAQQKRRNRRESLFNGVISFGPATSRERPIEFNANLNADKNRLKILFGYRYLEVYLNDQFVFRSFSKRFDWCHRVSLQQPSAAQGRGVVEFSNLSIKKWEQGPPPTLLRDAEALIAYYEKTVELEPDSAWAKFWLGHAKHLADDFEGAIPLYKEAVAAGLTPRFAGYYIGDACDRSGRYEEAVSWYQKASVPTATAYPYPKSYKNHYVYSSSRPEDWARFRLQWHLATKGELTADELQSLKDTGNSNVSLLGPGRWLSTIGINLAGARKRDDPTRALSSIEGHLDFMERSKQPDIHEHRETLQPVLEALKAGKAYVRPANEPPIYLDYVDDDSFFPHFERVNLGKRFRLFYEPFEKDPTSNDRSEVK